MSSSGSRGKERDGDEEDREKHQSEGEQHDTRMVVVEDEDSDNGEYQLFFSQVTLCDKDLIQHNHDFTFLSLKLCINAKNTLL